MSCCDADVYSVVADKIHWYVEQIEAFALGGELEEK